jgi:PPOX class probable F420-dependent enzyme
VKNNGIRRRAVMANKWLMGKMRSPKADTLHTRPVRHEGFDSLTGVETCLVVTYRKDGRPVAQPVWPGHDPGRLYVWTEENAYKAKRVQRNPNALIAPCTFSGKPLADPIAAHGRVLETDEERAHARDRIRANWGWKQKVFEFGFRQVTDVIYLEFVPQTTV